MLQLLVNKLGVYQHCAFHQYSTDFDTSYVAAAHAMTLLGLLRMCEGLIEMQSMSWHVSKERLKQQRLPNNGRQQTF